MLTETAGRIKCRTQNFKFGNSISVFWAENTPVCSYYSKYMNRVDGPKWFLDWFGLVLPCGLASNGIATEAFWLVEYFFSVESGNMHRARPRHQLRWPDESLESNYIFVLCLCDTILSNRIRSCRVCPWL